MKKFSRYGGIVVLICGFLLYMIAGKGYSNNTPINVTSGIMVNGEFREINSGAMGGSSENQETFSNMQTLSLVCVGVGGLMFLTSFIFWREEESPYM